MKIVRDASNLKARYQIKRGHNKLQQLFTSRWQMETGLCPAALCRCCCALTIRLVKFLAVALAAAAARAMPAFPGFRTAALATAAAAAAAAAAA
eukprot:CAMPEP_0175122334 /NCGR_PEP_ID=MMETSP0087-20121206/1661_1 /TAXON_ID=136419 /ORGANISM="Unknown Unknown, Strain D1" /LENGTH=93 /DNA_ID=CAMNT_0016403965 /DNA_START=142 /DNA_END=421 /DNA_ORIENTATION=+